MLIITIELWPQGDRTRARHLGTAIIANDGTGSATAGNYGALFWLSRKTKKAWRAAHTEDFPRKRLHVWDLLYRLLREAVGKRNA